MTPKFAQAVDPIFLHVLDLLDRISKNEKPIVQDERLFIKALLDRGEAIVGTGRDWELAKYALVSWIDELLVELPWSGQEWWSNNVLEMETFNSRLCFEQFFVNANEASTLAARDALEVYYVCVILGFRGLYREPELASSIIQGRNLAPDLNAWATQMSMAIRLGQGRPQLAEPRHSIRGAPPLRYKTLMVWSWLAAVVLGVCTIVVFS